MSQIYTIGETVLDIVFKQFQPVAAKSGGSMLNTAVSLGRLGLPIHFISEYGTDEVGQMIDGFLTSNGVDTSYVHHFEDGKSALALAFLDANNNANYSFYKAYPAKRLDVQFPTIQPGDIVLFGSNYGISLEIRDSIKSFLIQAKKQNAFLIYDPNFRKSHLFELDRLMPAIRENISFASLVRCSDEDMDLIFNAKDHCSAYDAIKMLCPNLIYTSSSNAVFLHTPTISEIFPVNRIKPVSTIGAGDNFNAGLVYGLSLGHIMQKGAERISLEEWTSLIRYGVDFASEVCMSYDNYISESYAKQVTKNS